ncbi:amino acid/amide ABC transporter membrane protein 1, HAAT family [Variovorax sp. YR266]|uniref:branched-chain amino acid ABC transporter permease n=1 Tax=Variovorax sp. YR266 TaxID=1884386 RepID=UPI000895138E|nr:branched-chain amino acid ABC transporter permease [Variovorax sp. YR266]SDZ70366.1 amino acid/amide ABC transporter membrane protein 1, HAAT family [Variovorax sp. YR266]
MNIFDIPAQAWAGQILIGLINGSFYAILSLGLAVIFGLLNIVNFAHGAFYMMGAMATWMLGNYLGLGYWASMLLAPLLVGLVGIVLERLFISRIYHLDHTYSMLLTYGMTLMIESLFRNAYGTSGLPYSAPVALQGGTNLGVLFMPNYRLWVVGAAVAVCLATWLLIEKTRLGAYLRAATENASMARALGINVPRMLTLTYGCGVGLAALAGVFAVPVYGANPAMGSDLLIVVFAVVAIGGMGSILGSIVTGLVLGLMEGLTKVVYPEASTTVVFVAMIIVLLVKPTGLFGESR